MIRIGTSGFRYDDWVGRFYPPDLPRREWLTYYARQFPTVEINSTFYRIPSPATFEQMARRVPATFDFVVKANRDLTHSGEYRPDLFAAFREAIAPLREQGKLGGVLAQFPWSFHYGRENLGYLERLRDELAPVATVIEFRNREWVRDDVFEALAALGLGFCCVDEPRLKGLMPPICRATSPIGYVRFHGRNAAKWWHHEQAHERYDYRYSEAELCEWLPCLERLENETERVYVFFNNHYLGQAGENARMLAQLLQLPLPLPAGEVLPRGEAAVQVAFDFADNAPRSGAPLRTTEE